MILVDSSIWVDHFKKSNATLSALLASRLVVCHPFIVGELALGQLSKRVQVIQALNALPMLALVPNDEVLDFVERYGLMGQGIGWIDVHLLASTLVSGSMSLWTSDRRLAATATSLGIGYNSSASI